ncbi:DUF1272 domain-containing protein [Granulicella paludicola]|uniref:DUF1272 domain-containing protein n=1 Tax=Granulicella paludicola TaxID=474951 RepID=UPI0037BE8399
MKTECELCEKALLLDSEDVLICSYECTFCSDCSESRLGNICPNCGGELSHRPTRRVK